MVGKKLIIFISLLIFIILIVLFNFKSVMNAFVVDDGDVREIVVDAKMFEFNPNIIKVKEGEKIKIKMNNLDVEHSIYVPELDVHIHDEGEFVATKKGTFNFSCHTYCGSGHDAMKGVLVVE
ncbi:MAG: cupredoxin domain-containing protein [Nanoarchaeota archaeon]|nr:cupredoxin domain-containing protein [Nanoarchaeota archaeon]